MSAPCRKFAATSRRDFRAMPKPFRHQTRTNSPSFAILCPYPDEISAINPYNHEAIQQFDASGRDHEQIHGCNVRSVVSQKGPRSLTGRCTSLDHVLGDG